MAIKNVLTTHTLIVGALSAFGHPNDIFWRILDFDEAADYLLWPCCFELAVSKILFARYSRRLIGLRNWFVKNLKDGGIRTTLFISKQR